MLIEFTGCSGAGKTALREAVIRELSRRGLVAACPLTALLGKGLSWSRRWPALANVVLDARILPGFAWNQIRSQDHSFVEFQQHCQHAIHQNCSSWQERLRLKRSLLRKLALHRHLGSGQDPQRATLIDEGIIHLAQILHGRSKHADHAAVLDEARIHEFCRTAPKPDLLVLVRAPLELLEQRIAERNTHQPLPGGSLDARRAFLRRTDTLIQIVAEQLSDATTVVIVENQTQALTTLEHHAKHVVDAIGKLSGSRPAASALVDQQSVFAA